MPFKVFQEDYKFNEKEQEIKQKLEEVCKSEYPHLEDLIRQMYDKHKLPNSIHMIVDGAVKLDGTPKVENWSRNIYYEKDLELHTIAKVRYSS